MAAASLPARQAPVVLDPLAPQVAGFGVILRPGGLAAVERIVLVLAEVEILGEQAAGVAGVRRCAPRSAEEGKGDRQAALQDVVELLAGVGEGVDVHLGEEQVLRIEGLQVALENLLREGVVEGLDGCSGNGSGTWRSGRRPEPARGSG